MMMKLMKCFKHSKMNWFKIGGFIKFITSMKILKAKRGAYLKGRFTCKRIKRTLYKD